MKRIAFFIHNFHGGGAEKVTINLANELANLGYDITIIVINRTGALCNTIDSKVNIVDFKINNHSKIMKNMINILKLKKEFDSGKYDVLISVTAPMNLIAAITKSISKNKIELYATIHSVISRENRTFKVLRYKLIKLFDRYINKTIVVSKEAMIDYVKCIGIEADKAVTIYNPVVSDKISEMKIESVNHRWLNENREFKTIIAAGRLTEAKDYPLLLKAIEIVKSQVDVRLIILGEGELREELERLSKSLNIDNIVDLYGFVDNPYKYFDKCDLYVLSSKWEGLPTVMIEAMACGCNIVSTNCISGPKEILDDGEYGILSEVGNEKEFAQCILDAFSKKVHKKKQISRANDFSIDRAIKEYINLINRK